MRSPVRLLFFILVPAALGILVGILVFLCGAAMTLYAQIIPSIEISPIRRHSEPFVGWIGILLMILGVMILDGCITQLHVNPETRKPSLMLRVNDGSTPAPNTELHLAN